MRLRNLGVIAVLAGLLVSAAACSEPPTEYKATVYIFGTLVDFTISGAREEDAREAVGAVEREFQRMHTDWHAWKPGELTRLNQAIHDGRAMRVSPFLLPLLVQARSLSAASDNLFNPAIGALIAAWGFHNDELPSGVLPDLEEISRLAALHPTMADVEISGDMVSSRNRAVQFDFGAFAKGAALDRAMEILRAHGIENAIINAGGDLNTLGKAGRGSGGAAKADGRPWHIGIRAPAGRGVIAAVDLAENENLYTSGNYERYRESEGIRYSHIIDPRDGMPVRHIVSASVIDMNGAVADAAATALSVAGPRDWHRIALKMGIKFALLVDENGTVYLNPEMKARVEFAKGQPPAIVVSPPL